MATNYTEHYGLSLWEANDKFYHQEFNENHQKIDDAIHTLAARTETALAGKAAVSTVAGTAKIVTGTYVGTGKYGTENPNTLNFAKVLDRPVKLVLVRPKVGRAAGFILIRGMTSCMSSLDTSCTSEFVNALTWTDSTVSWSNGWDSDHQFNNAGEVYCYIAIG